MSIIPNTFQTFNLYVDRAMPLLTDPELRVLLFASRHIMGWQDRINDRRACISLSMFENGFTTAKGATYGGCGLKRAAIIKAIQGLVLYGFLVRVGEPTAKGQEYQLGDEIDWNGLENRHNQKAQANYEKTVKATNASLSSRGVTSHVTGTSDDTPPVTSHVTTPGNVARYTNKATDKANFKTTYIPPVGGSGVSIVSEDKKPTRSTKTKRKSISQRWNEDPAIADIGNTLLRLFGWDGTVDIDHMPTSAVEPFFEAAMEMNRAGMTPADAEKLHAYVIARAKKENWTYKPSVGTLAKYFIPWKSYQAKRDAGQPIPFAERVFPGDEIMRAVA